MHAKEREALKNPTKSRWPALRIPCPPDCVEEETNAYDPSHEPVSNRMRAEIEKNPSQKHGDDSNRCGVCRPRRPQCKTCSQDSASLQGVANDNRGSRK